MANQLDNFKFDLYDEPRITGSFDIEGVPTDPTTITFLAYAPDGTTTTYVYATDAEVVRTSAGEYYVDFLFDQVDLWRYCWRGTGTVQASTKDISVNIRASVFP